MQPINPAPPTLRWNADDPVMDDDIAILEDDADQPAAGRAPGQPMAGMRPNPADRSGRAPVDYARPAPNDLIIDLDPLDNAEPPDRYVNASPAAPVPSVGVQPVSAPDESVVTAEPRLSDAEMDDLLARIALYPDVLLAQILPACTYPVQIVQAARWLRTNPDLTTLEQQPFDPSVLSLCKYPEVLYRLDEDLDWANAVGAAFLNQQPDVMNSIQRLRARAQQNGALQSTPQQVVVTEDEAIRIVPAEPQVVYVPQYDPVVVYSYPTVAYYTTPVVTFGAGWALGSWLYLDCNWGSRCVSYCQPGWWGGWGYCGRVTWRNDWCGGPRRWYGGYGRGWYDGYRRGSYGRGGYGRDGWRGGDRDRRGGSWDGRGRGPDWRRSNAVGRPSPSRRGGDGRRGDGRGSFGSMFSSRDGSARGGAGRDAGRSGFGRDRGGSSGFGQRGGAGADGRSLFGGGSTRSDGGRRGGQTQFGRGSADGASRLFKPPAAGDRRRELADPRPGRNSSTGSTGNQASKRGWGGRDSSRRDVPRNFQPRSDGRGSSGNPLSFGRGGGSSRGAFGGGATRGGSDRAFKPGYGGADSNRRGAAGIGGMRGGSGRRDVGRSGSPGRGWSGGRSSAIGGSRSGGLGGGGGGRSSIGRGGMGGGSRSSGMSRGGGSRGGGSRGGRR